MSPGACLWTFLHHRNRRLIFSYSCARVESNPISPLQFIKLRLLFGLRELSAKDVNMARSRLEGQNLYAHPVSASGIKCSLSPLFALADRCVNAWPSYSSRRMLGIPAYYQSSLTSLNRKAACPVFLCGLAFAYIAFKAFQRFGHGARPPFVLDASGLLLRQSMCQCMAVIFLLVECSGCRTTTRAASQAAKKVACPVFLFPTERTHRSQRNPFCVSIRSLR